MYKSAVPARRLVMKLPTSNSAALCLNNSVVRNTKPCAAAAVEAAAVAAAAAEASVAAAVADVAAAAVDGAVVATGGSEVWENYSS